jgi:hypothetical protein
VVVVRLDVGRQADHDRDLFVLRVG